MIDALMNLIDDAVDEGKILIDDDMMHRDYSRRVLPRLHAYRYRPQIPTPQHYLLFEQDGNFEAYMQERSI